MQRSLAKQLIALLLLLALVAGGDRFAVMTMSSGMDGMHMSDIQKPDTSCKACGGMTADMPCDAVCAALPAIDASPVGLADVRVHDHWMTRSEPSADYSIRPDTSPPRA
ncbi:hypothetical protein [Dongia deserti]|uniref:hypothetical protein n=1 Tax=Dongia deserti TaxID=2268030 RepID=UPI0013C402CB|nr:hypothetical protein [Dongia deserti]